MGLGWSSWDQSLPWWLSQAVPWQGVLGTPAFLLFKPFFPGTGRLLQLLYGWKEEKGDGTWERNPKFLCPKFAFGALTLGQGGSLPSAKPLLQILES